MQPVLRCTHKSGPELPHLNPVAQQCRLAGSALRCSPKTLTFCLTPTQPTQLTNPNWRSFPRKWRLTSRGTRFRPPIEIPKRLTDETPVPMVRGRNQHRLDSSRKVSPETPSSAGRARKRLPRLLLIHVYAPEKAHLDAIRAPEDQGFPEKTHFRRIFFPGRTHHTPSGA